MAASVFDEFIAALRSEMDEATAFRVINCLIKTCGGERVYVPVKVDQPAPILPTDTPKTIQKKHQVSRSTSYRLLNKHRI